MTSASKSSQWLVRDAVLRLMGVCYCLAFISVYSYHHTIPSGAPSIATTTTTSPSLFSSPLTDDVIMILAVFGVGVSLLVMSGYGTTSVVVCALQLNFLLVNTPDNTPDRLLLECGVLAICLAPALATSSAPPPSRSPPSTVVLVLLRWLGIRVLVVTGIAWLRDDAQCVQRHLACYDTYYETQPSPNPIAWYLHHWLPRWIHQTQTVYALVCHLVVPWCWLLPWRRVRVLAAYTSILYQATTMITGSYAFLNVLLIVPAVAALDDDCALVYWWYGQSTRDAVASMSGRGKSRGSSSPSPSSSAPRSPQHEPLLGQRAQRSDSLAYSNDDDNDGGGGGVDDDDESDEAPLVSKVAIDDTGRSSVYISSIFDLLSTVADDDDDHRRRLHPTATTTTMTTGSTASTTVTTAPTSTTDNSGYFHDAKAVVDAATAARGDRQLGVMFTEVDDDTLSIDSFMLKPRRRAVVPQRRHERSERGWFERWIMSQAKRFHPLLEWHASCISASCVYRHRVAYSLRVVVQTALVVFVVGFSIIRARAMVYEPTLVTTGPLYAFNTYGSVYTFPRAAYRIAVQHSGGGGGGDGGTAHHFLQGGVRPEFQWPVHRLWLERQAQLTPYAPAPQWLYAYLQRAMRPDDNDNDNNDDDDEKKKGKGWARAQLYRVRFGERATAPFTRELVRASYVLEFGRAAK